MTRNLPSGLFTNSIINDLFKRLYVIVNRMQQRMHPCLCSLLKIASFTIHVAISSHSLFAASGSPFYQFEVIGEVGTPLPPNWQITDEPNPVVFSQPSIGSRLSITDSGRLAFGAKINRFTTPPLKEFKPAIAVQSASSTDIYDVENTSISTSVSDYNTLYFCEDGLILNNGFGWPVLHNSAGPGPMINIIPTLLDDPVDGFRQALNVSRANDGGITFVGQKGNSDTNPFDIYHRSPTGTISLQYTLGINDLGTATSIRPSIANNGIIYVNNASNDVVRINANTSSISTYAVWTSLGREIAQTPDAKFATVIGSKTTEPTTAIWLLSETFGDHKLIDYNTPIARTSSGGNIYLRDYQLFTNPRIPS